jgi:NTP pyrophosphatase (non-canonical NTP hydrolase)
MENIFQEIKQERVRQDEKWKEQNHPIVNEEVIRGFISEQSAKDWCDIATQEKCLTWGHIIIEEIAEALHAPNKESMREELVQCAAVIVAMIESLDRNGK